VVRGGEGISRRKRLWGLWGCGRLIYDGGNGKCRFFSLLVFEIRIRLGRWGEVKFRSTGLWIRRYGFLRTGLSRE
jgi:hypothetical protein